MKLLILSLSWIVLIVADQESVSNIGNSYDGREAPTLKPTDYSDAVFQPGFAQNPNSRIFFRYKQKTSDHVPQVQVEKENIQHYFRVRKPIARRKIFHIQKESLKSVPLAGSHQVINVTAVKTESTPQEFVIKNDMEQDKHIDYVLDKLPELFEVTQETIIAPLLQETNDKNYVETATINETEDAITASNDIIKPQEYFTNTDMRPNSQNNEKFSGPYNEEETDKSDTLLLLKKNSEDIDLINIEEPNEEIPTVMVTKYNDLETTTKASSTPELEIFLLSNVGLKWEMNDTVDNVPKLLVEELIMDPDPSPEPIVEDKFTETRVFPNHDLEKTGDKNESSHQSLVSPIIETDTNTNEPTNIISSPVVTETSEPSSEIRLAGIKGHLLSNLSNTIEDSKQNVTFSSNDGNKSLKSPRRRTRKRKLRKNKIDSNINTGKIEDLNTNETIPVQKEDVTSITTHVPTTDVTATPTTTLSQQLGYHYNTKIQTSTPRSHFTHHRDIRFKLRGRNGIHRITNPIEETEKRISLPSSDKVHHPTTTLPYYTQYRAKSKFRKWNRNRNITPTVINPLVDFPKPPLISESPTNNTEHVQNVSPLPGALEQNRTSANSSDAIEVIVNSPKKITTSEQLEISTLNPTEMSTTANSPRRMRFRNKLRYIRTSTQSTPSASVSTTGTTVEVISTTLGNKENSTTVNQSTGKFKQPPPPPPTLSPWYDGFGK